MPIATGIAATGMEQTSFNLRRISFIDEPSIIATEMNLHSQACLINSVTDFKWELARRRFHVQEN